jgi:hypothetical protein
MDKFRPSLKNMMAEFDRLPNVTAMKSGNYIVLSRGDYVIYVAIPDSKKPVSTYKQFWDESKNAPPKTPANLLFRYEVSSALGRANSL